MNYLEQLALNNYAKDNGAIIQRTRFRLFLNKFCWDVLQDGDEVEGIETYPFQPGRIHIKPDGFYFIGPTKTIVAVEIEDGHALKVSKLLQYEHLASDLDSMGGTLELHCCDRYGGIVRILNEYDLYALWHIQMEGKND